jgi:hypothetical protein
MPAFKPTAGRKAGGMRPGTLQKQQQGAGASSAAPAATALFDPAAPGAIVVNAGQWQDGKGKLSGGRPVIPVVGKCLACGCLSTCLLVLHGRQSVSVVRECRSHARR